MQFWLNTFRACLIWCVLSCATTFAAEPARRIDFSRDVRPILSDHCFVCHGPDDAKRAADLRLDQKESLFAKREETAAVVPGKLDESELYARITSTDPTLRMPPQKSGRPLTPAQIETLAEWIRQGATWTAHWAFVKPLRHEPPVLAGDQRSQNDIDRFILKRLRDEGLTLSPEADRRTLLRRVSLDLTGLPPTPEEVESFLKDNSANAYETVVDRLLASPRYGEHMAVAWLDAARYADTSGYQNDGPRDMWRWRDWVIDSFNANQPFDQFTIEQLAGDLLPGAMLAQRIATGFNRNHRGNAEGGIIPEEYQVEYVVDRVDTTATVWLGLTMGCARCHDHKYDPIRQSEYYRMFAYFNNIPESGRAIKEGNSPPYIKAPTPPQAARLADLDRQIAAAEAAVAAAHPGLLRLQQEWEARAPDVPLDARLLDDGLIAAFPLDGAWKNTIPAKEVPPVTNAPAVKDAPAVKAAGAEGPVEYSAGVFGEGLTLNGAAHVSAGDIANFGYFDKFSLACWVRLDNPEGTVLSRMTPVEEGAGYALQLTGGRLQVNLVKRWLDDAIRVETRDPLPAGQWCHLAVTYDGTRLASGIRVWINGQIVPMEIRLDRLNQTFAVPTEPFRIGGGQTPFRGAIDDVRVYSRDLSPADIGMLAVPQTVAAILKQPRAERTPAAQAKLAWHFLEHQAPAEIRDLHHCAETLRRQRRAFDESLPTVMVMHEMDQPRPTHVLTRGQYDLPGDRVEPGVPATFPPLPADAAKNRLALAQWLVSPEHPLTTRVAVNRFWQRYFGKGLVRTPEDFGVQGAPPTHPELLDWLATEFMRTGWNVKQLQKLMVMSAAYRQSSSVSPELLRVDPDNRWLARAARRRLPAEVVRDQALFVSGLLKERVGGPSVKPYQPDGLWKEIATDTDYIQSHGDDLYRRSLYTYWKRTVAPPTMVTLDAAGREACIVQRSTTNTPLQALALMNDITYVEAARVCAQRLMADPNGSTEPRIRQAYQKILSREPTDSELAILLRRHERNRDAFRSQPESAKKLLATGESPLDASHEPVDLAALTTIVSLILNLDETVTRE